MLAAESTLHRLSEGFVGKSCAEPGENPQTALLQPQTPGELPKAEPINHEPIVPPLPPSPSLPVNCFKKKENTSVLLICLLEPVLLGTFSSFSGTRGLEASFHCSLKAESLT